MESPPAAMAVISTAAIRADGTSQAVWGQFILPAWANR
jgi:hypothetical protein